MLTDTKILVLGGSGFLGANLVNALLEKGAQVRIFHRGIQKLFKINHPRLEIFTGDFISGRGLDEALVGMDAVYHLIHTTIPSSSNINPVADIQNNLIASVGLLKKMQDMKINRIIYISSGGTVYGNPSILPVPETHSLYPLCSYGIVKVAIENYLNMFSQLYGLETTILRVANPYGLLQKSIGIQGIISTLFQKIMQGEKIQIWGDGSIIRDYIYIDDVVIAMIQVLTAQRPGIYNIGSGIGYSLNTVINLVSQLTGIKAQLEYLPARNFDVEKIFLDISKACEALDWRPTVTLQQGCERYWNLIDTNH